MTLIASNEPRTECLVAECIDKSAAYHPLQLEKIVYAGDVSDSVMDAIGQCRGLKHLGLRSNSGVAVLAAAIAVPSLKVLGTLYWFLPEEVQLAVAQHCPKLHTFRTFRGGERDRYKMGVTDAGIRAILECCPQLQSATSNTRLASATKCV
jgi:hypothetical protein